MFNQVQLLFDSLIKDGQNCLRVLSFQMRLSRFPLRFVRQQVQQYSLQLSLTDIYFSLFFLACIVWQYFSNLRVLESGKAALRSAKAAKSLGERQLPHAFAALCSHSNIA